MSYPPATAYTAEFAGPPNPSPSIRVLALSATWGAGASGQAWNSRPRCECVAANIPGSMVCFVTRLNPRRPVSRGGAEGRRPLRPFKHLPPTFLHATDVPLRAAGSPRSCLHPNPPLFRTSSEAGARGSRFARSRKGQGNG